MPRRTVEVGNIYYFPPATLAPRSQPSLYSFSTAGGADSSDWRSRDNSTTTASDMDPLAAHIAEVEGHAVLVVRSEPRHREAQVCVITSGIPSKYPVGDTLREEFFPLGNTPSLDDRASLLTNYDHLFSNDTYVRVCHPFPVDKDLLQAWKNHEDVHIYDSSWRQFVARYESMNKSKPRLTKPDPTVSVDDNIPPASHPPSDLGSSEGSSVYSM